MRALLSIHQLGPISFHPPNELSKETLSRIHSNNLAKPLRADFALGSHSRLFNNQLQLHMSTTILKKKETPKAAKSTTIRCQSHLTQPLGLHSMDQVFGFYSVKLLPSCFSIHAVWHTAILVWISHLISAISTVIRRRRISVFDVQKIIQTIHSVCKRG